MEHAKIIMEIVRNVLIANNRMTVDNQGESLHMDIWQRSIDVWHHGKQDGENILIANKMAITLNPYNYQEIEELLRWVQELAD